MKVYEIPGKLTVEWNAEVHAIIDTWSSYFTTLEEFKEAVLVKGLNHAKANGGIAWIVDSHTAKGVFSPEIQKFIETDVFPAFAANGIKYFLAINAESAVTRLTVNQYTSKLGPAGIKLLMGTSTEGAIEWLKKNA